MIERGGAIWDKKAERFPRFSDDPNARHFKQAAFCEEAGVCFEGAEILDIGCGTGRHSLLFAPKAARVDALDVSSQMLEVLQKEAAGRSLSNIRTIQSGFDRFTAAEKSYDVVFSCMTPAIAHPEEIQKAIALARKHWVYIGWGHKRESPLLESIFADHDCTFGVPKGAPHVSEVLRSLGFDPQVHYHDDSWMHDQTIAVACEDIAWHLEINGAVPDKEAIMRRLEEVAENGRVRYETRVQTGTFILPVGE
jgi:SAM-dependent methyltransferase